MCFPIVGYPYGYENVTWTLARNKMKKKKKKKEREKEKKKQEKKLGTPARTRSVAWRMNAIRCAGIVRPRRGIPPVSPASPLPVNSRHSRIRVISDSGSIEGGGIAIGTAGDRGRGRARRGRGGDENRVVKL